jgi:hypothetical protein
MNKRRPFGTVAATLFSLVANASTAQSAMPDEVKAPQYVGASPEVQSVSVKAIKDPEIKAYRSMLAGLDAFDKYHDLAPDAPALRFVLSSLSEDTGFAFTQTKLSIRGDTVSIPVPIGTDNSFVLPRNKQAEDDNADLILDLRKGQIRGRPDVRSPGIPVNMRRLGDLRLECEVRSAIAKADMNFVFRGAIATATLGRGLCNSPKMHMGFFAGKNINGLTLISDTRREPLTRFSGPNYFPPIGDKSWPDNTLVEFMFDDVLPLQEFPPSSPTG